MLKHQTKTKLKVRSKISRINLLVVALVFGAIGGVTLLRSQAAAPTVSLYLQPANASITKGSGLTVSIYLQNTSSNPVNYVKADLNFSANVLSISSLTPNSSDFPQVYQKSIDNSSGAADLTVGSNALLRPGTYLVGTITFTGVGAGGANAGFTNQSAVEFSYYGFGGPNMLTGTGGGSYTVNNPPAPKPVPRPRPASPAPAPPTAVAAPVISAVQLQEIAYQSVQVYWQTDLPTTSVLAYTPQSGGPGGQVNDNTPQTGHTVTVDGLQPGATYNFTITASSSGQNSAYNGVFSTLGLPVNITAKTAAGRPAQGKVTVGGVTETLDKNGSASFNLPPGPASAEFNLSGRIYSYNLMIKPQDLASGGQPQTQRFLLTLPAAATASSKYGKLVAAVGGLGVLGLLTLLWPKLLSVLRRLPAKRKAPGKSSHPSPNTAPSLPAAAPQLAEPPPHPPPKHLTPPPHATSYPWVLGETVKLKHPGSSVAAGDDYVEPEDMFAEGKRRLEQEGLGHPKSK